jgi:hypothetical protein
LEQLEDINSAATPEQPFTVDDTGQGLWMVLTALLVCSTPLLIDWIIWDASQGVQPW